MIGTRSFSRHFLGFGALEWLVALALSASPFTQLRISIVGPGELALATAALVEFAFFPHTFFLLKSVFVRFWLVYISLIALGAAYGTILAQHPSSASEGSLFDFAAYAVILASCMLLSGYFHRSRIRPLETVRLTFYVATTSIVALYLATFFTDSLFGLSLRYYDYFVPLADNLHQTASFMVVLPFFGVWVFARESSHALRLTSLVLLTTVAYAAYHCGSTKAPMSLFAGSLTFVLLYIYQHVKQRRFFLLAVFSIAMIAFLSFSAEIFTAAERFFEDEDRQQARAILYRRSLDLAVISPIVGYGPGAHVWLDGQYRDAHQTFLTAFLQGGFMAVLALGSFFATVWRTTYRHPALAAALVSVVVYALGGDVLRRLPLWILMLLLYHAASSKPIGFGSRSSAAT